MNTPRFTPEFKEDAVRQIVERGYSVADVPIRRFDGLDKFDDLPMDGRCVACWF